MSNSKVIEVPENILESLKCTKCSLYLSVTPVTYDKEDNLICGRCVVTQFNFRRAKAFEVVQSLLLFPCRYRNHGCQEKFNASNIPAHEEKCDHKNGTKCPLVIKKICNWQGSSKLLEEHCVKLHPTAVILKPLNFTVSLDENSLHVLFFSISSRLFVVRYSINIYGHVYLSMQSVSASEANTKFHKYEIEFKYNNSVVKFRSAILNYTDNFADVFSNGHIKVSTEILKSILNISTGEVICTLNVTAQETIINLPSALKETPEVKKALIEGIRKKVEVKTDAPDGSTASILNQLKCPNCLKFFKAPILVCTNGHSFCNKCLNPNQVCQICPGTYDGTRNKMLEKMIQTMQLACENENLGCKYVGKGESLERHVSDCSFKPTECPLKEKHHCLWQGIYKNHSAHLSEVHASKKWFNAGDLVSYKLELRKMLLFNIIRFNDVLIRVRFEKSTSGMYSWTFHQVGIKDGYLSPYKIRIEFIDQTQSKKSLIVGLPCYGSTNQNLKEDFQVDVGPITPFISNEQVLAVKYRIIKTTK